MAAERNAQARVRETHAQVRQIIHTHKLPRAGEIEYAFDDAGSIKRILVDASQRTLLAKGVLVIARHDSSYVLLARAVANKVLERAPAMVVLDHGSDGADAAPRDDAGADDAFYDRFQVPDDRVWSLAARHEAGGRRCVRPPTGSPSRDCITRDRTTRVCVPASIA